MSKLAREIEKAKTLLQSHNYLILSPTEIETPKRLGGETRVKSRWLTQSTLELVLEFMVGARDGLPVLNRTRYFVYGVDLNELLDVIKARPE